jgi:hypothetical protein
VFTAESELKLTDHSTSDPDSQCTQLWNALTAAIEEEVISCTTKCLQVTRPKHSPLMPNLRPSDVPHRWINL